MKLITIITAALLTISSAAYGITPGKIKHHDRKKDVSVQKVKEDKILLLSWQGDYLYTTKGTVSVKGIPVKNLTGMKKDKLNQVKKLPEVLFTKSNDTIVQVDIVNAD